MSMTTVFAMRILRAWGAIFNRCLTETIWDSRGQKNPSSAETTWFSVDRCSKGR